MSKNRERLQTLSLLLIVAVLHVPFFLLFCIHKTAIPLPHKKEPLKVMTRIMHEPKIEMIIEAPQEGVTVLHAETAVIKEKVAPLLPKPEKKIAEKKIQEKKKEVAKTASSQNKESVSKKSNNKKELLALLETSLQKTQAKASIVESKEIALQSEGLSSIVRFEEELVIYLQQQLTMPYPGKVSLAMTLSAEGKLLELKIKECKEQENRLYLEQTLGKLLYPSFVSYFPKEKNHLFSLTFYIK